jgi:hypothetical protein
MSEGKTMSDSKRSDLEARIRELEDVREINDVWFKWHHECTGGFNGIQAGKMEALECLTDDATIEVQHLHQPGKGPRGREQYTEFWKYYFGDAGPLPHVFQVSVADKVKVTGDTAVQQSVMLCMLGSRGRKPRLMLAQRTNDFVRTTLGWRIKRTTHEGTYYFEMDQNMLGNLNSLPAQEPRTPWSYKG